MRRESVATFVASMSLLAIPIAALASVAEVIGTRGLLASWSVSLAVVIAAIALADPLTEKRVWDQLTSDPPMK